MFSKIKLHPKLSNISITICLITIAWISNSSLVYADVTPEIEKAYQEAIKDAEVTEYSEIYRNLTAITKNNPNLEWEGKPGESRLKVAQWTAYSGYTLNKNEPQTRKIWVTVVPELKKFCTQYINSGGKDVSLRLKQLLGLNPNWQYSNIVEMWVDPKFLFRPTPDPEISDHEAGVNFPVSDRFTKVEKKHQDWLTEKRQESFQKDSQGKYNENAQPWTALGYTYDWGNPKNEVGLSEFVIEENPQKLADSSSVEVISITPTVNYCSTSNIQELKTTDDQNSEISNFENIPSSSLDKNTAQASFKNDTNTMLIPNILNVAINLLFIYLAVSLLVSALQEQVVVLLALRARNLKSSIETLLGDGEQNTQELTNKLYKYPLIKSLNQQGNKWLKQAFKNWNFIYFKNWNSVGPSYLKSATFSDTLLEILRQDYDLSFDDYSEQIDEIINKLDREIKRRKHQASDEETSAISNLPDELLTNLYALARQTKNKTAQGEATLKQFQENISRWFDESMERATGVYKRNAFGLSLLLGLLIAILGNIDTIHIINQLYNDPALNENLSGLVREKINTIEAECKNQSTENESDCIQSKFSEININELGPFPIGWEIETIKNNNNTPTYKINLKPQQSLFLAILGWLITAFALAQGSPFWFDLLSNVIQVRSSGKRYDSKEEKK